MNLMEQRAENETVSNLLKFSSGDPGDPINWSGCKKKAVVANLSLLTFVSVLGSSIYAPGQLYLMQKFRISVDLASSGLSLYLLGFATGPLIWGPLSEKYGRRLPYIIAWPLLLVTTALSAFVDDITAILLFRYFAGCCSGCPLNNGPGIIADMYHNDRMGQSKAVGLFAFCTLTGPCFGFLIGFFVAAAGWNGFWVLRLHFLICTACWAFVFMIPESHGPTILARRAHALRRQGHTEVFAQEELESSTLWDLVRIHFLRPAKMLIHEPISQGAAIWIGLAYGIIYFFFEVYPTVFIKQHNMPFRFCGLMFLFIPFGMFIALVLYKPLTRLFARIPLPKIVPKGMELDEIESDLKIVLFGCTAMPISLLWLGWSSGPETHWVVPALAGVLFGNCITIICLAFVTYLSNTYTIYSSSASAVNTFCRSIIAAMFPVVTHNILETTGTKWGVSIFAFLSLGLFPIPLIFIRYGKQLRARSRFAQEAHEVIMRMGEYDYGGNIEPEALCSVKKQVAEEAEQRGVESTASTVHGSTADPGPRKE